MMDVAWLTRHLHTAGDASRTLHRIDASLTKAIESTRQLVDELQPALLDSVGLFVAIGAHFGRECRRFGIRYSETVSGDAPEVDSSTAMTVFRITQELLHWLHEDAAATKLHASYRAEDGRLTIRFVGWGVGQSLGDGGEITPRSLTPRLASIGLRLREVNGTAQTEAGQDSVAILIQIPAIIPHPSITDSHSDLGSDDLGHPPNIDAPHGGGCP
jgi:signal transduction histidine kinase